MSKYFISGHNAYINDRARFFEAYAIEPKPPRAAGEPAGRGETYQIFLVNYDGPAVNLSKLNDVLKPLGITAEKVSEISIVDLAAKLKRTPDRYDGLIVNSAQETYHPVGALDKRMCRFLVDGPSPT